MKRMIDDLTPLNRVLCSAGYDASVDYLRELLPFQVLEYKKKDEFNGWTIPPRWDPQMATISRNGKVIYDALAGPLRLIVLSTPFHGTVDLEELKAHLHYDSRYPDAVPYHFRQEYRSWEREWGFCVTREFYESLEPGDYRVDIDTLEDEGALKVLEYTHHGKLAERIILMSHLDHPGMSNDGLAGCAVGVEVMKRLQGRETKFSYSLFLHQEIIGSEYFLGYLPPEERTLILEGVFLEMLGSETQIGLQAPPTSSCRMEESLARSLSEMSVEFRRGDYGDIVVNGEYIWAGYGIPVASFSRYPYPEYHCDKDNPGIITEAALNESAEALLRAIDDLEQTPIVHKRFQGSICTSNPAYDLYVDPGQPALGSVNVDERTRKLRVLMERIPLLHRATPASEIAGRVGLDEETTLEYLREWEKKGLLELV